MEKKVFDSTIILKYFEKKLATGGFYGLNKPLKI